MRALIDPLPSQEKALNAQYRFEYVLFGGAAGPGKSRFLRWAAVEMLLYYASQGHRDVRVGLFCEDYPTLKDRQVSKIKVEFPAWLGTVRNSQDEGFGFYLHPKWGGGAILLRNLDDPAKYASTEFAAIYVDELTKNPRDTFDALRFRKRWPGIEHSPFVAASNPGSIGHGWVKKLWITRDFTGDDDELNPDAFHFIPALAGENHYLPASYMATLQSLPEALRRAMLHGDWDVFEGQVFEEWRAHLHVIDPFPIPRSWTRWRSVDYGYANPFCALWYARPEDKKRIVVYRELYATGWRAQEQAKRILAASEGDGRMWATIGDPSMWQVRHETVGDSIADEYLRAGLMLHKANNDRLAGLAKVREALNWKELPRREREDGSIEFEGRVVKPPRLQIFRNCTNLIRTLPDLPYDEIKTEDVDTDAEDHAYDSLRYGLMADAGGYEVEQRSPLRKQQMGAAR